MNITQFRSISVSFGSMDFFYFKAEMLELQKSFLIIRFFNRISCRKDQNFMFLSCVFSVYPAPPPIPLTCAGMSYNQKDCFRPDVTQAKESQKLLSMELHKWSKNVVNVENCQSLKGNYKFLSVIWLKWKQGHSIKKRDNKY